MAEIMKGLDDQVESGLSAFFPIARFERMECSPLCQKMALPRVASPPPSHSMHTSPTPSCLHESTVQYWDFVLDWRAEDIIEAGGEFECIRRICRGSLCFSTYSFLLKPHS